MNKLVVRRSDAKVFEIGEADVTRQIQWLAENLGELVAEFDLDSGEVDAVLKEVRTLAEIEVEDIKKFHRDEDEGA